MQRTRKAFIASLTMVVLAFGATCPATAQLLPGEHTRTMMMDGVERHYEIHIPPGYDGSTPEALIVDSHGFLSNHLQQRGISGFRTLSDTEGFIVVYALGDFGTDPGTGIPNGPNNPFGPSWNGGDLCCGSAIAQDVRDIRFLRAVVSAVATEVNIDLRRVYATGLSNGGAISQRLACDAADAFAASAPMAFPIGLSPLTKCQPAQPIPVLAFAGTTDQLVPYDGVPDFGLGLPLPSAQESFAYWRDVNGCGSGLPDQTIVTGDATCETYTSCDDGVQVGLCSLIASEGGLGHVLYANNDLVLAEEAWAFFDQFTLPSLCLAHPATGCKTAGKSVLTVKSTGDPAKSQLKWKWLKGEATDLAEFGDPASTTEYAVCVYDSTVDVPLLETTVVVPSSPLWAPAGSKGFKYKDKSATAGGAKLISLKAGAAAKAKVSVKASGSSLEAPDGFSASTLFGQDSSVTVQLVKDDGACWTSEFTAAKKNTGELFKATAAN